MRLERLGDSAYIVRDLTMPPHLLANALNESPPPGLIEAVASYETVGIYVDPFTFDPISIKESQGKEQEATTHQIPVCYELGEDTEEVCQIKRLTATELIRLHTSIPYQCYAVGFCPGFAYLGYLPDELSGVPRRSSPRVKVEPGSVAITGRQTAVYPLPRPGGWALIGKTPLTLVDVEQHYFPIKAGDEVHFYSISASEYEARLGERL